MWFNWAKSIHSETNNIFKNSYLKSIIFFGKNETFYNKISCNQNNIGLKYFAYIRFGMFKSNLIVENIKFSEIKILQCIKMTLLSISMTSYELRIVL